jgi:hypothetical protein
MFPAGTAGMALLIMRLASSLLCLNSFGDIHSTRLPSLFGITCAPSMRMRNLCAVEVKVPMTARSCSTR